MLKVLKPISLVYLSCVVALIKLKECPYSLRQPKNDVPDVRRADFAAYALTLGRTILTCLESTKHPLNGPLLMLPSPVNVISARVSHGPYIPPAHRADAVRLLKGNKSPSAPCRSPYMPLLVFLRQDPPPSPACPGTILELRHTHASVSHSLCYHRLG